MAGSWREEDKGSSTSQSGWQAMAWLTPVECACGPGSRITHTHTASVLDALLTRLNLHDVPGKQTVFWYADFTWNWPLDRVSRICITFPVFWTLRCNYWIIPGSKFVCFYLTSDPDPLKLAIWWEHIDSYKTRSLCVCWHSSFLFSCLESQHASSWSPFSPAPPTTQTHLPSLYLTCYNTLVLWKCVFLISHFHVKLLFGKLYHDLGSVPGWGKSPGEGNGNPLQYPCLGNAMDRGAWLATVHRITKSWTLLSKTTAAASVEDLGPEGGREGGLGTQSKNCIQSLQCTCRECPCFLGNTCGTRI